MHLMHFNAFLQFTVTSEHVSTKNILLLVLNHPQCSICLQKNMLAGLNIDLISVTWEYIYISFILLQEKQ